jgi:hypothetical protein
VLDADKINGKVFRRRKKSTGKTWKPSNKTADDPEGVWCRDCKMRHAWGRCNLTYRKNNEGLWVMGWTCPTYGNVIKEQVLRRAHDSQ